MSRIERLENVLDSYGFLKNYRNIEIYQANQLTEAVGKFDRVLVDVPCSTDRSSIQNNEGSIFSKGKAKERAKLTTTQKNLLL